MMAVLAVGVTAEVSAATLPVELGFEYGNGLTLSELSEIGGSHVLNSCDDEGAYATADHSPMPGYSGKHGYPGSFTSVGDYYFQIKTRVESDWYDIAVEKGANGQPAEGVSLEEGKSLYIDFLADLTTFDDDPTISFQQPLRNGKSLNAILVVARAGCLVSIDRNIYLYRHEILDDRDEPVATNWCVVAADRTGTTPVRKLYELTHVDGSPFPANEDGFDRITVQATRPTGEDCLVYRVFVNGLPTAAAGGVTAFSSLSTGFAEPTAVRVVGFSGRGKVDDFVVSATPPAFLGDTRVEKGCVKVVSGSWPHVAYDQCPDVDFAVDRYGKAGWDVCFHGSYARGYVVPAVGSIVGRTLFRGANYEATGAGETFTFAFHYDSKSELHPKYPEYWGWVTLGTDARGDLVVLDSAVCEKPDVLVAGVDVVSGGGEVVEARPHISLWKAADQGGWMELMAGCIPRETEGLVVIPNAIDGKPVRVIGSGAFAGCDRVTAICVPDAIREIGERAFSGCRTLMVVNLPDGLEKIGADAFSGCCGLLSLTLPAGLSQIGPEAFPTDGSLIVHLPKGESARLLRLICTDPSRPTETVDPKGVTFAEDPTPEERKAGAAAWLFYCQDGEVVIGDLRKDRAVPEYATGAMQIPTELAGRPVLAVGDEAFRDCLSLTAVKIPPGITRVGCSAFAGCRQLAAVEIPISVAKFESSAFQGCDAIVSATIPGGTRYVGEFIPCPDRLVHVAVADGSVKIGERQFSGCVNMKSVALPSTLRVIEGWAFQGCYELLSAVLPDGLLEIGEGVFDGCGQLMTLAIPGSVAIVGRDSFRNLCGLRTLTLGEGVRVIGDWAFAGCERLGSVRFPSTLVSIGEGALQDCRALAAVELPVWLTDVGKGAFSGCENVRMLKVPGSLTCVGYQAFRGMSRLKTLVVQEGVSVIGEEAFANCDGLEKVVLPTTLQLIDRYAFLSCCNIRSLDLPEGLVMVDEWAFGDAYALCEIHVPSSLVYVGCKAFSCDDKTVVRTGEGDVSRVSGMFEDAEIKIAEGQIVEEGHLTKSEKTELANQLVAETVTTEFMRNFAALQPEATVTVAIPDAQPGLTYALGVSATIEGLAEAVQNAPKAVATAEGVTLTVVKPAGNSAFFRMSVGEP